jgi:FkbM family methyltransferase
MTVLSIWLQALGRRYAEKLGRKTRLIRWVRPAYESFLNWSSGNRGIPWTINGIVYRVDAHQRHRLGQVYDAPVADFLRTQVRPGAICYNVGANIGIYVLQFAHWSSPSGRVIAFEPNPRAGEILKMHIRFNALQDRVQIVAAAVGAVKGEAVLYAAGADGMSRLAEPNPAIADRVMPVPVPVVTLDEFYAAEGLAPDWLMIDIEGFELAALAGARELIKSRRNNLGIVVEMHPNDWALAGTTRQEAESLLTELGLRALPLTGQVDPLGEYGHVRLEYV